MKRNCQKFCDPKVAEYIFKMFQKVVPPKPSSKTTSASKSTTTTTAATTTTSPLKTIATTKPTREAYWSYVNENLNEIRMIARQRKMFREFYDLFYRRIY